MFTILAESYSIGYFVASLVLAKAFDHVKAERALSTLDWHGFPKRITTLVQRVWGSQERTLIFFLKRLFPAAGVSLGQPTARQQPLWLAAASQFCPAAGCQAAAPRPLGKARLPGCDLLSLKGMRSRHESFFFFFFALNLVLTGPLDDIARKAGQTTQAVFFDERFCGSATLREFRLVYYLWPQHTRQLEEEANFSIMDVKLEDVEGPFFTGIYSISDPVKTHSK